MSEATKACTKCKETKPLSDFFGERTHADGRASQCKECDRLRKHAYKEREAIKKRKQYWSEPEKHRARRIAHRLENGSPSFADRLAKAPLQMRARRLLSQAVRSGTISKPTHCEDCGSRPTVLHGHHEDYNKPLSVNWLCVPCHGRRHRKYEAA